MNNIQDKKDLTNVDSVSMVEEPATEKQTSVRQGKPSRTSGRENRITKDTRISVDDQNAIRFPKRAGYHRHLANGNIRIEKLLQAGYTAVEDESLTFRSKDPSQLGQTARIPLGAGDEGLLMEIPEEWHKADLAKKKLKQDERMAGVSNIHNVKESDTYHRPEHNIKIGE